MVKLRFAHLSTLLLWIPSYCIAQVDKGDTLLKNEVSVSIISLNQNYGQEYTSDNYFSILNGIKYRRHFARHAFRVGGEYRNSWSAGHGDFVGESRFIEGKFNLGYQYAFSERAIKPYMALDLIYLVSKLHSDFAGGYAGVYSELNLHINGIGYAPTVGISFVIVEPLTISWEGNVEFLWFIEKGTNIRSEQHNFQSRHTYPVNNRESYWFLNPLKSISLNYRF